MRGVIVSMFHGPGWLLNFSLSFLLLDVAKKAFEEGDVTFTWVVAIA